MVTVTVIFISIVVIIIIVLSAFQFGKELGKTIGRTGLKKDINEMTVRELLAHKRDKLKNV
jgi:hypothetical protein